MTTSIENEIHQAIKRSPQAMRARLHASDGAVREAALPGGRNRAAAGAALLKRLGFSRCELLDKSGAVVDEVVGETAAGPVDLPRAADLDPGDRRVMQLLEVVIQAQDRALARRESEFRAVLAGVVDVMKAQSTAMSNLASVYQEAGEVRASAAADAAYADSSSGSVLGQVAELAPHLPALLSAAKAFSGGGS